MKHALRRIAVVVCILLCSCTLAETVDSLSGSISSMGGNTRYSFPQFAVQNEADEAINQHYALQAEMLQTGESRFVDCEEIAYEIIHFSDRYVSVLFTQVYSGGNGSREEIAADTFARDGVYAGQRITLSRMLGMEETNDGQKSMAAMLAYDLIWDLVSREAAKADGDYPEGIAKEDVLRAINPETDFFLDEEGNIVFFVQSGELASEIAGILRFPFAPAELLSSAKW